MLLKKDQNLIRKIVIKEREQDSPEKMCGLFDRPVKALSGSLLFQNQSLEDIAKQIKLVSRHSRVFPIHPGIGRPAKVSS